MLNCHTCFPSDYTLLLEKVILHRFFWIQFSVYGKYNVYSICSKQIFKNIANISKWKERYIVWLTWPPTITVIRHWVVNWRANRVKDAWPRTITVIRHRVVNWRANRVKDALPRDWTVHGPWYLCFGSEMLSTWCSKEKRTRLPSNSFETFCVNGGDLFKRDFPWVQEVTSDSIG